MRWVIEVEETVKVRHQVYVKCNSLEQLDDALAPALKWHNLEDFLDELDKIICIDEVNEDYYSETEDIEYVDDYEDDRE